MNEITDANLYADHTYRVTVGRRPDRRLSTHPATVVTCQRSWRVNIEARVRVALQLMLPHDFQTIEGIEVKRTTWNSKIVYIVNRGRGTTSIDTAVAAILAAASAREREGL